MKTAGATKVSTSRISSSATTGKGEHWRWGIISVFVLSNSLNFLDRQLLSALAPTIRAEFHLSNAQYGKLLSAFSLAYGIVVPFAGIMLDRIGLVWGAIASVIFWSSATAATGVTRTFNGLMLARAGLGAGEAGALPSASKANAAYLPPSEWAVASAVGSFGVMIGSILAPQLAATMAPRWGWRSVFVFSGLLGLGWAVLWKFVSKRYPARFEMPKPMGGRHLAIATDKRMWGIAGAYSLVMVMYMFWMGWMTIFLVQELRIDTIDANRYFAWIPSIFGTVGGFLSSGLVYRWIRNGIPCVDARMRIARWAAPATLISAIVPWIASPSLAVVTIGVSLLFCTCVITSLNIIPLDLFGRSNAGFTISIIACSYSLVQAIVSPLIGGGIDHFGFKEVCVTIALFPLMGITMLDKLAVLSSRKV